MRSAFTITPPPKPRRGQKLPDVVRRSRAIETTQFRFQGKEFEYGKADCIIAFRSHLVAMGHKNLPKIPAYKTALGAKKALKSLGFDTLTDLLDSLLEPIPPASVLAGDIVMLPPDESLFDGTVVISVGYKVLGWHPDVPQYAVLEPQFGAVLKAWRA